MIGFRDARRGPAVLVLALLLPLTQGCVAAVIPLAAGAVMGKTQLDKRGAERPEQTAAAVQPTRETSGITRLDLTELPPPDSVGIAAARPIRDLHDYALAAAQEPTPPGSAMLVDSAALSPVREPCGARPLAVFIDLDPGRGTFDPLGPGTPEPALVATLADLRAADIAVVWFSRLGDNFMQPVRQSLAEDGLDPDGTDRLVLMRDLDERKQTRRKDMAKELCPIAFLGDERADFDELYLYLKQADAALPLETMIGKGWFLASPFTQPTRTAQGIEIR